MSHTICVNKVIWIEANSTKTTFLCRRYNPPCKICGCCQTGECHVCLRQPVHPAPCFPAPPPAYTLTSQVRIHLNTKELPGDSSSPGQNYPISQFLDCVYLFIDSSSLCQSIRGSLWTHIFLFFLYFLFMWTGYQMLLHGYCNIKTSVADPTS